MARVAVQKTALPHNHPLHRPLKKRQAEACQRIHALWGLWPWELLVPVVMYDASNDSSTSPYRYDLEHPQDWSDNILDTLRKLALSTTLPHAIARIGYHAALLKVSRLSVRLAKAVTTECEVERERTPPNPKAGSGPIVNRRNKKTLLNAVGSPNASKSMNSSSNNGSRPFASRRQTDPGTMGPSHLVSPRSSTPQSETDARSPESTDSFQFGRAEFMPHRRSSMVHYGNSPSSRREWPGLLTLPNLHEAGLQLQAHSGARSGSTYDRPHGLITPLAEETTSRNLARRDTSGSLSSNPFSFHQQHLASSPPQESLQHDDDLWKRKTSPRIRDAMSRSSMVDSSTTSRISHFNNNNVTIHSSTTHIMSSSSSSSSSSSHPIEHTLVKRQKRTLLPGFVELPAPRLELTPPTSPTSPPSLSSLLYSSTNNSVASSTSSSSSSSPPPPPSSSMPSRQQPLPSTSGTNNSSSGADSVRLPPLLSAAQQRHHSFHHNHHNHHQQRRLSPELPSSSAAALPRPPLCARSFSCSSSSQPLPRHNFQQQQDAELLSPKTMMALPPLLGSAATASPSHNSSLSHLVVAEKSVSGDNRMNLSFLI